MDHARWRSMSLEQRYEALHGSPQSVDVPAAVPFPTHIVLTEEERERQAHDLRVAKAAIALENALAEEAKQAERERRVTVPGAIGMLMKAGARS
jgi:hypothetical protein